MIKRIHSIDVALAAGVSRATVSAVINNSRHVSEKSRNRVIATMNELNYQPNEIARSLKFRRTKQIGLIVGNIASPHWARAISSVESVTYPAGYQLLICDSDEDPTKELMNLRYLLGQQVDGIILAPCGIANQGYMVDLTKKIPIILFDRHLSDVALDSVACDNYKGAYLAVSHLIEKVGYRRIACLAMGMEHSAGYERLAGYKKALEDHKIPITSNLIRVGDYGEESGYQDTLDLLKLIDKPFAIFACSHMKSIGVLRALTEMELSIPRDVGLIGFDDFPWSPFLSPPLTVVSQPSEKIAIQASKMLLQKIQMNMTKGAGNCIVNNLLYSPKLIIRESCGYLLAKKSEDFSQKIST